MSWGSVALAAAAGGVFGGAVGFGIRKLLGRIPRGVVCRPGPVELASALLTAAGAALAVGTSLLALVLWLGFVLIALSAVDLTRRRLPDALTLPAIPVTVAVTVVTEVLAPGTGDVVRGLVAGALLVALFGLLALISPRAMGLGDVKLVASIGVAAGYLSWGAVAVAILGAFVLGAVVSVAGISAGRLRASSAIAFGPFLLLGCWLVLAFPGAGALLTS